VKFLAIIIALIFTGWVAFGQGHRAGLESAPEMIEEQRIHNRNLETFFAEQFDNPTSQELMCDKILDLAMEELSAPIYSDQ